jgi:hypothetical protein
MSEYFMGIAHVLSHTTTDQNGSRASRPCHFFTGD